MKTSKPINLLVSTLLCLIFSNSLFSQKLEPKKRQLEPDHTIASEITGRDYQLYISFPLSYSTKDSIPYPVLYVMDGMRDFDIFNLPNKFSGFKWQTEDVIIVGVDSGLDRETRGINRIYDYTPTKNIDTASVSKNEKKRGIPKGSLKSGGAAQFLEVLKTEIIPFVEKSYKTNTDRGISGHSLGGLFTAYCLLNSDGYFTRFGINSPSLWWNKEKLLDQAILQFTENKTWDIPPTKVFMSVGGQEGLSMAPTMVKYSAYLDDAAYDNIDLSWHVFDNETHVTVIPISLRQTLAALYTKKRE